MDAKQGAKQRFDGIEGKLIELSHRIHAKPELAFEEEAAAGWIGELLGDAGFDVESGVCELPTAVVGRAGSGPLHVAFCAEYDALPGIGHACGHNIIAAASVGAAIAAAQVADDIGLSVSLIGTPGEEICDGGGKILLLERGAFAGVHAAMMVHPAPVDIAPTVSAACAKFEVEYRGKEAHSGAFPEQGINAADALTVAQTAIGLLRQHIGADDRIHGIITKGGDAVNVVPAHTCCDYMVRSKTFAELKLLHARVIRCFEAGALATGSSVEVIGGDKPYAELIQDEELCALYRSNAEARGRRFPDLGALASRPMGSTDMGNISHEIPSIHPAIGVESAPATNHQPEFAAHSVSEAADRAVSDGALALAWTAIDAAVESSVRSRLLGS